MPRALLVEDEPSIRLAVRDALAFAGHEVDVAEDGETALARALGGGYDVIVLDLMLPRLDGLEVCRRLRAARVRTPLLMLTARGGEQDRVEGLACGADDYVPKPFSVKELLARVAALIRRAGWASELGGSRLRCGGVEVDLDRLEARRGGAPGGAAEVVGLSGREGAILRYLARRRAEVVSKRDLLVDVWDYPPAAQVETRTVENTLGTLRRKIEENPDQPRIILTVRGEGFKLGPDVALAGDGAP
jgi:DNA-binding response OmpR family regulator